MRIPPQKALQAMGDVAYAAGAHHVAVLKHALDAQWHEVAAAVREGRDTYQFMADRFDAWQKQLAEVKLTSTIALALAGYRYVGDLIDGKTLRVEHVCGKAAAVPSMIDFGHEAQVKAQLRGRVGDWVARTSKIESQTSADQMQGVVHKLMQTPVTEFHTLADVSEEFITAGLAKNEVRAELMARTMAVWAYNAGAKEQYRENGITRIEWLVAQDDALCEYCNAMSAVTNSIDQPFFQEGAQLHGTGEDVLTLGIQIDHPPLHPRCRCTLTPVVDLSAVGDQLGKLEGQLSALEGGAVPAVATPSVETVVETVKTAVDTVTKATESGPAVPDFEKVRKMNTFAKRRQAVDEFAEGVRRRFVADAPVNAGTASLEDIEARLARLTSDINSIRDEATKAGAHPWSTDTYPEALRNRMEGLRVEFDALNKEAKRRGGEGGFSDPARNRERLYAVLRSDGKEAAAKGTFNIDLANPNLGKLAEDAQSFLDSVLTKESATPVDVRIDMQRGVRAYAGRFSQLQQQVVLGNTCDTRVLVHELAHVQESASGTAAQRLSTARINDACVRFRNSRSVDGGLAHSLNELTGRRVYDKSELAIKDKFKEAYAGKLCKGARATEIFSVGMEQLYADPVKFATEDPDYFKFIISVARGWI